MARFATLPPPERQLILNEVAARLGVVPVIVEKDFWVCWALGRIFETPEVAPHVVFKGGTSLAKVFALIERFSEDIDLAVSPQALGFAESELNDAPSANQRRKRMQAVAVAAEQCVAREFQPALEAAFTDVLGRSQADGVWLRYELDATAGTPNILFAYPSALPQPGGYIAKQVKLEFGALTNQQPTARHGITALLASAPGASLAQAFDDLRADVVSLALERSFWEKATILHAEFHRPAQLPIRDRFARHYADFAALAPPEPRPGARPARSAAGRRAAQKSLLQLGLGKLRQCKSRKLSVGAADRTACRAEAGLLEDDAHVSARASRLR